MIEGYCRRRSYAAGEAAEICVSTDATSFDLTITREGGESIPVHRATGLAGLLQPVPADVVANGCGWDVSVQVPIPPDWRSGFYRIELRSAAGEVSDAFLVVRKARPKSRILWVLATNTWNAYNPFGGASTYVVDGRPHLGGAPVVSFERPFPPGFIRLPAEPVRLANVAGGGVAIPYHAWAAAHGVTFWTGSAGWPQWDATFACWLEDEGIEVDYATSSDLHERPDLLDGYALLLSVGHDEYWSWEMRDAVEAFIARGGNAAFLSANTCYWQVRLEAEGQRMVAYKDAVDADPVMGTPDQRRNTGIWSHRLTARPETRMTGVSFARGGYTRFAGATPNSAGGYTIYRPGHWALEGTGLSYGDQLGAASCLVGYECDGCVFQMRYGLPEPTGEDGTPPQFEIIGIAPAALWDRSLAPPNLYAEGALSDLEVVCEQVTGDHGPETLRKFAHGHAIMGAYTAPGGGTVFTGGTTEWAFCLTDPQVAGITRNLIRRLGA